MLHKAAYVTLFVSDQDRALDFYTNVLGFEKRADRPVPTGECRFLTVGLAGQDLEVVLWPGTAGKAIEVPGLVPGALIIETNDCREDFEVLKARGATFETDEVIEQPIAFVAVLKDPDGNRIMIREPRSPIA